MLFFMFSAADDPVDHVSVVRLGSVQQRHGRVLLVWNTIQGASCFITNNYIEKDAYSWQNSVSQ